MMLAVSLPTAYRPLIGLTVRVEHAGVLVGDQTGEGAEVADDELDRVERAVFAAAPCTGSARDSASPW